MTKARTAPPRLLFRPVAEWMARAACRGLATGRRDPWHPGAGPETDALYAVARRVCATCPVRLECLTDGLYLLETAGVDGMWGGHTPGELKALAKSLRMPARKKAQHGTRARYVAGCKCELCRWRNARDEHERRTARTG